MQNMYKWLGLPSDEWAFFTAEGARSPITRAVLAFFLDKGLLDNFTAVYQHVRGHPAGHGHIGGVCQGLES